MLVWHNTPQPDEAVLPSPSEITKRCEFVQAEWSEATWGERSGRLWCHGRPIEHWEPPLAHDPHLDRVELSDF